MVKESLDANNVYGLTAANTTASYCVAPGNEGTGGTATTAAVDCTSGY